MLQSFHSPSKKPGQIAGPMPCSVSSVLSFQGGPDGLFLVPAYPVDAVTDPTGAGDTFAGAMMGYLAQNGGISNGAMRAALLHGAVVASHGVEAFSLDRLAALTTEDITTRFTELKAMTAV